MEDPRSLTFPVRYRLGEYLSFSSEHAFATQQALRELTGVRRHLAQALLKAVATGAMPVPFRVLSAGQREMFRSLAGERMGEVSQPSTSLKLDPLRGSDQGKAGQAAYVRHSCES